MELQEGKYYRDENGKKVGPMRKDPDFSDIWDCKDMFPNDGDFHWFGDGKAGYAACDASDLIAEWVDEPMKTGTLQELNVQAGDVVECVNGSHRAETGKQYTVNEHGDIKHYKNGNTNASTFRIISRAPRDETPKLWRDMTAEEKGALLLAEHEGRTIQGWDGDNWFDMMYPPWLEDDPYRVKPNDVRETVRVDIRHSSQGYIIGIGSIDLINGEPDPASIRMERI